MLGVVASGTSLSFISTLKGQSYGLGLAQASDLGESEVFAYAKKLCNCPGERYFYPYFTDENIESSGMLNNLLKVSARKWMP